MQYRSLFPSSTITVVEIDPVVHYVANLCFGLIEDGTMLTTMASSIPSFETLHTTEALSSIHPNG